MKGIITRLNYRNLKNEAHVEFHNTVDNLFVVEFPPETIGVRKQYDVYKPLFEGEVSLLDVVKKSSYTGEIKVQNNKRNTAFRGLSDQVKSSTNHFNLEKQKAALQISIVLDNYGNIAARPIDQETAAIDDLLRELRGSNYSESIALLNLEEWLTQLDIENRRFRELMFARYEESAKRPTANMRETRIKVDKAFMDIVRTIEALVLINGITDYEPFIIKLNVIIEHYKNIIAR
ncbi:MAG: DUF6261 family protein [Prevotellaceae bacterium]|jgi:hypothetical protein|nr:DUF6261 family protein [Prevotellaceae bacterium]